MPSPPRLSLMCLALLPSTLMNQICRIINVTDPQAICRNLLPLWNSGLVIPSGTGIQGSEA